MDRIKVLCAALVALMVMGAASAGAVSAKVIVRENSRLVAKGDPVYGDFSFGYQYANQEPAGCRVEYGGSIVKNEKATVKFTLPNEAALPGDGYFPGYCDPESAISESTATVAFSSKPGPHGQYVGTVTFKPALVVIDVRDACTLVFKKLKGEYGGSGVADIFDYSNFTGRPNCASGHLGGWTMQMYGPNEKLYESVLP